LTGTITAVHTLELAWSNSIGGYNSSSSIGDTCIITII
jgi:hypothetical protein